MASKSSTSKNKNSLPSVNPKYSAEKVAAKGKTTAEQPAKNGVQNNSSSRKTGQTNDISKLPSIANNKTKDASSKGNSSNVQSTIKGGSATLKPTPPLTAKNPPSNTASTTTTSSPSEAVVTSSADGVENSNEEFSSDQNTSKESEVAANSAECAESSATADNPAKSEDGGVKVLDGSKRADIQLIEGEAPLSEPVMNNGQVTLIYERYDEKFPIVDGTTTQENIDEVYCLSFVMPDCLIHLSNYEPAVKRKREADGLFDDLFLREDPPGTYHGLIDDQTYYVYVEQKADQLARDQERMRRIAETMEGAAQRDANGEIIKPDDGRAMETCSCIYGNPCVDEYGCKDWTNRYAVAKKNGWKGF